MSEKDYSDLGREIGDKINKFVNSKEIKDLQENIRVTVETTMHEVSRSVKDATEQVNKNVEIQRDIQKVKQQVKQPLKQYSKRQLPVLKRPPGSVSGTLMTVFGSIGAVIGGLITAFSFSLFALTGEYFGFTTITMAMSAQFTALCIIVAIIGGFFIRRAKRFKKYIKRIDTRDFYSIKELSYAVHKEERFVIKDLKKMIKRGWFREGHLDKQETCFMLTDESYQMYQNAQLELERRKEEEALSAKEKELIEQDPVRKQLQITVEEGKEYIRRIREINDEIPGEDISNKLYRLENVCARIFEHIEEKPEKLSDIRKFMNYYLPTTLKLVEAYHEFSVQPVQGENITSAKNEIEETLDSISSAFEKMFDKLFEDDALDISTDISVLSTMLAQEGLLEDEFKI